MTCYDCSNCVTSDVRAWAAALCCKTGLGDQPKLPNFPSGHSGGTSRAESGVQRTLAPLSLPAGGHSAPRVFWFLGFWFCLFFAQKLLGDELAGLGPLFPKMPFMVLTHLAEKLTRGIANEFRPQAPRRGQRFSRKVTLAWPRSPPPTCKAHVPASRNLSPPSLLQEPSVLSL